jgi:toxin CcdB
VPVAQQFDVFRTAGGVLVVVIQSDLLETMRTRVVAPLLPAGTAGRSMRGLNPEISFGEEMVVLMPQLLATLTIGSTITRPRFRPTATRSPTSPTAPGRRATTTSGSSTATGRTCGI